MKIANIPFPLMVLLIDHYKLAVQPDYGLMSKILHIQLPPCMMYIQKKIVSPTSMNLQLLTGNVVLYNFQRCSTNLSTHVDQRMLVCLNNSTGAIALVKNHNRRHEHQSIVANLPLVVIPIRIIKI